MSLLPNLFGDIRRRFRGTATISAVVPVPLPALPLATGAKLISLGHQATGGSVNTNASGDHGIQNSTYGVMQWMRFLDPRFNADSFFSTSDPWGDTAGTVTTYSAGEGHDGGEQGFETDTLAVGPLPNVPCTNTPGTINRATYALARGPGVIYLEQCGENDIQGGRSAAAIIADLDALWTKINNAGVYVITRTVMPSWPSWSTDQQAVRDAVQAWIVGQIGQRPGVKIADLRTAWADSSVLLARTVNQTGQTYYDQLTHIGAYKAAQVILPVLQGVISAGSVFNHDATVANLLPNYSLAGTTGTKGTGVTGSVGTGWTLNRITGTSTAVASLEQIGTSGLYKQVITITPVNDGTAQHRFRFLQPQLNFSTVGLADGDWVQQAVYIEFDSWIGWSNLVQKIDLQGSPGRIVNPATMQVVYNGAGTGAVGVWLMTEPVQIRAGRGLTSFRSTELIEFYLDSTQTGTGVLKISQPILRKVSDPHAAWNL